MKKIVAFVLVLMAAVLLPAISYAIDPKLKEAQDAVNAECPMDMSDGMILKKIVFTDKAMELHISSEEFAELTKGGLTESERKAFHNGFLEGIGPDDWMIKVCDSYGLKLVVVMYKPSGEFILSETFLTSEFK